MSLSERWRQWAGQPLWSLGFRPFFLAGSGFACLAQVIWGLWLHGAWSSLGLGLSALLGGLAFAVFVAGHARILLTARL